MFKLLLYNFDYAKLRSYATNGDICLVRDVRVSHESLHSHDYYEIVYIYDGGGVQVINGTAYTVNPGSILLLQKTDAHSFYALKEMAQINCCFKDKQHLNYFPNQKMNAPVIALNEVSRIEVEQVLYLLEMELKNKYAQYSYIANACIDWILLILQRNIKNQIYSDPLWGKLLSYISENYATVTLLEAVHIVGVSTGYFCRIFKQAFGMTFHNYVDNIRVQRAKNLLKFTDYSISVIGERVGYVNNPSSFYSDFKKITTKTPKEYREDSRKESDFFQTNDGLFFDENFYTQSANS